MSNIKCFIVDLDGTVYRGNTLVKNADRRIIRMRQKGKVLFVTNNASLSRKAYVKKLKGFGIPVILDDILTSAYVSAVYIHTNYHNPRVFVIGNEGLIQELKNQGIEVCHRKCNIVLVGLDKKFNYDKLKMALKFIRAGAEFIATNEDNVLMKEKEVVPGAGAIVASLKIAADKEPIIIGKPSDIMADFIITKAGVKPEEILLIGDSIDCDIKMGKNFGMKTALVLTGLTSPEDLIKTDIKPDYVFDRL
mgnify:FL=1|jgi:HAD superfamily hydrolase (TIGR01457 family)|tara:strand:- start:115 stop:861 length:747 start_codon:yes stop_codon:yes gene_type:complete